MIEVIICLATIIAVLSLVIVKMIIDIQNIQIQIDHLTEHIKTTERRIHEIVERR